jgi:hypothetical protein
MEFVKVENDLEFGGPPRFTFRGECPHCRHLASFAPVTSIHQEGERWIEALQCTACQQFILGILRLQANPDGRSSSYVYDRHYPLSVPDDHVSPDVPENIRSDFREALLCRWVKAYKATGVMCGRALEAACIGLGSDPKTKIGEQIDYLATAGKITTPLRQMAHAIKLGRNRGAHPPEDGETEILNEPEADALIAFMIEFFHHVYVLPAKLKALDLSKSATKGNA